MQLLTYHVEEPTASFLVSNGLSLNFPGRFWAKVWKTETCWLWTAYRAGGRYGAINRFGGKHQIKAHRASWILHFGPIPEGFRVLHTCDDERCVHPGHLWLGTQRDNMADMVSKGRSRGLIGEAHKMAKLTVGDVRDIRSLWFPGNGADLARTFGVTRQAIWRIVHGKCWSSVPLD